MDAATPPIETVRRIRDECLCLAAQRAARVLARRFDRLFAPLGITNGQFSMLVALSGQWQPKLRELAGFLAMDQTTMSAAIRTLERNGLVILVPDASDARVRRPQLTRSGRDVVNRAIPLWIAEHDALQADIAPATDPRALAGLLSQLG